jgi:hypothetical protein
MKERRRFIKWLVVFSGSLGLLFSPLATGLGLVWAKAKKIILPNGTRMETLIGENPAILDTQYLDLTPLEKFGTIPSIGYS